ncbi:phosphate acetyltransferase [Desulfovibrio inopinatus]|uniref:phosphate acetyltransferase n=1 Tax=Desulfovibrio inopinatus TaxID=102109 RepID=UPI00041FE8D9|nr:phosphate acetyltransferase [Desulfovibrio inopinatus]
MAKSVYITATEQKSGKSAICLGFMQLLLRDVGRVAFFRPIITSYPEDVKDHDISLILSHFHLDMAYEDTHVYTLRQARDLVNAGRTNELIETILSRYKKLESEYDFIVCEGTDYLGHDPAFEFDINAEIAANIGSPVALVTNANGKDPDDIVSSTRLAIDTFYEKRLDVLAAIINRVKSSDLEAIRSALTCKRTGEPDCLIHLIPEEPTLGNPSMDSVRKWLKADVLYGHGRLDALVGDYVIAAMQVGNFLEYIEPSSLVITPGDREDIILACLASRLSTSYADISGVLLTGGLQPSRNVHRLIEGWTGVPVSILSVKEHTYKASRILGQLYGRIDPEDQRKIATALGVFEAHVNVKELRSRLDARKSVRVTPKMFEFGLVEKAKAEKQRIVMPEGSGERILQATDILLRRGVADITLIGKPEEVRAKASACGAAIEGATIINPEESSLFDDYVSTYFELRKHKGIRQSDARDRMSDPTYFGTMMVYKGDADGMVSGSETTTAQTIRPAFEFVKTKPGASIVSSVFLMCLKDRVLVFGDCAVNPSPTAQQLAEIAVVSAQTATIFGVDPKVAMLSYSTGASGKGEEVEKVKEAARIAKEMAPDLPLEGPIQYDAAVDPAVAMTKLPNSQVAGHATVFIFPDLNTGNNTYKAVQRAAQAVAIGPILQGLRKPVNDLSRGCSVPDIVNTVAITAIQAQAEKKA